MKRSVKMKNIQLEHCEMKIKILQNYYCVCFVLANYCWACSLPLTVVCRLCETSLEKNCFLLLFFVSN